MASRLFVTYVFAVLLIIINSCTFAEGNNIHDIKSLGVHTSPKDLIIKRKILVYHKIANQLPLDMESLLGYISYCLGDKIDKYSKKELSSLAHMTLYSASKNDHSDITVVHDELIEFIDYIIYASDIERRFIDKYKKIIEIIPKIMAIDEFHDNRKKLGIIYFEYLMMVKKDYDFAYKFYYSNLMNMSGDISLNDKVRLYNGISSLEHWKGNTIAAIEYQEKIKDIINNDDYLFEFIRSDLYRAAMYVSIMEYEKANAILNNLKNIDEIHEQPLLYCRILENEVLSDIFFDTGSIVKAYDSIQKAIAISQELAMEVGNSDNIFLSTYLLNIKKWIIESELGIKTNNEEISNNIYKLKKMGFNDSHRFIFSSKLMLYLQDNTSVPPEEELQQIIYNIGVWFKNRSTVRDYIQLDYIVGTIYSKANNYAQARKYLYKARGYLSKKIIINMLYVRVLQKLIEIELAEKDYSVALVLKEELVRYNRNIHIMKKGDRVDKDSYFRF